MGVDSTLGVLLIGTIIQSILFGQFAARLFHRLVILNPDHISIFLQE
jgi:hypothetical protein